MAEVQSTSDLPGPTVHARLYDIWVDAVDRGAKFPSEPMLSVALGISRTQLREALVRMEERGLIRRRHGADTVVNPGLRLLGARMDRRVDFSVTLSESGMRPTVEVLETGITLLSPADALDFGVPPGSNAWQTVKRWRGDGAVAMLARDVVPLHGVEINPLPPTETTLFDLVGRLFDAPLEWEIAVPGAVKVERVDADRLEIPVGSAVMTLDLTGICRNGTVAYKAFEQHVPGFVRSGFVRPGVASTNL